MEIFLNVDLENELFRDVVTNGVVPPGATEEDAEIAKYLPPADVATSLDAFWHDQLIGAWRSYSAM